MDFEKELVRLRTIRTVLETYSKEQLKSCEDRASERVNQILDDKNCEYAYVVPSWYQSYPAEMPHKRIRYRFRGCDPAVEFFYISENV